jgi:dihydrofolate synthase / folylpolyglutamate synthase
MNYPDSVRFLYALGNETKTAKLGLERIGVLLEALGNPQQACRIVHVAGTNGKGSTCAMIESGLRAAGYRTGLFTSPHLIEPTERIQIAGRAIGAGQFAAAFDQIHACAETLLRQERIDLHPTYFESVTAMAMLVFRECGVEFAVLEVGLGGRLDATNVVTPELCVVTPVDFDHEAYLGKSLESIAGEKAGILKPRVPAVFASQRTEAQGVLESRAAALGAAVTHSSDVAISGVTLHARGSDFLWGEQPMLRISCPLAGAHQVENARTAIAALGRLRVAPEAIQEGIAQTRWPGRLERVSQNPEIVLDGAHNPASARALAEYLERFYEPRRVWLIYGAMRDKAVEEMAAILFPRAGHVIVTAPAQARALRPESIRGLADHDCIQVSANIREALTLAAGASREDTIFVTGSLFLVGEARALLNAGDSLGPLAAADDCAHADQTQSH